MRDWKGPACLAGAFTLAGTSVIAARIAGNGPGVFTVAAISLLFALLALIPLCGTRLHRAIISAGVREWLMILMQAFFGIFMFRLLLLLGLSRTSASEAGVLTGLTPAATAILAVVMLKESMPARRIAGIVCTVAGGLIIQGRIMDPGGFSVYHLAGNLLVIGAALSESLFNVVSRLASNPYLKAGRAIDPVVQTALVAAVAFFLCLGPACFEQPWHSLPLLDSGQWAALFWYGVIVTALGFVLWYAGIKRSEASTAAAFSAFMPLTAVLLAAGLLNESLGLMQWAGAMMVGTGMFLCSQWN